MKLIFKPVLSIGRLTLLSFLLLASCSDSKTNTFLAADTIMAPSKQEVLSSPILQLQPAYGISIPGELEPAEQVSLYAKVNGFVKKLHVNIGDVVKKGQLLAVLEAPEMDQVLVSDRSSEQKLQSDYHYAQQNLDRLREAAKTEGAVAAIEMDRAESAVNSARLAYESAKAQTGHSVQMQKYLQVAAPFDGVVIERNVSEGALVGPGSGQPIFRIADQENLKLKIALPEKHAGSVHDTMNVVFTVATRPGQQFDAVLSRSSGMINSNNRAMVLEFDVKNSNKNLKGGEYAQVQLQLKRQAATLWVNPKSILNTQSGVFVLTKNSETIRRIPITEGVRLDTIVEVFGDLKAGDLIVQRPTEQMR